jgi:hypothetical protein
MTAAIVSKLTRDELRRIFPDDDRAVRAFEKVLALLSESPTSLPSTVKSNEVLLWLSM